MENETLLVEKQGFVDILTLNRPPTNAVSHRMLQEIGAALDEVERDRESRVLVITGAGDRAFSSGMDVADSIAHPDVGEIGRALWARVDLFGKPTIAAVNGHALGGGCELALACHFRFMADNPKALIGCPEVNLGIAPGWGGNARMTRLLGRAKALDLILNARRLSPREALEAGLVDRVFPPGELMARAMEYAAGISGRAPLAVQTAVRSSTAFLVRGIDEALTAEEEGNAVCVASRDASEGFAAFIEKRVPVFTGE